MPIVSAIQMTSTPEVSTNLAMAEKLILQATKEHASLVVLPEMFPIMGGCETDKVKISEPYGKGPLQEFLSEQARKNKIWIVGGTIPLMTKDERRVRAACLVYDAEGEMVARYDKIHLFDVCVDKDKEEYNESELVEPGEHITVVNTPIGRLGVAVCYDLRFPELFRNFLNAGVQIFAVPTAFTVKTGAAHWEVLARARALENLSYGIYACQVGKHSAQRATYGHSMIVNPWGKIITELSEGIGVISAEIDLSLVKKLRAEFPIERQQRIFATKNIKNI